MNNKPGFFLLAAVILIGIMGDGMAVSPTREEFDAAALWTTAHLGAGGASLPFSFVYDGKISAKLLREWTLTREERRIDAARTEYVTNWSDARSGLVVRCVCVRYEDFPAVEWTLYFKNEGTHSTPILKDILALDTAFMREGSGEFVLRGTKGDWCTPDSFQPFEMKLEPGMTQRFASYGGRPTNGAFPYYNLHMSGGGILLAIGWPGQWASTFVRDQQAGLHVTEGQELLNASLNPGEVKKVPHSSISVAL